MRRPLNVALLAVLAGASALARAADPPARAPTVRDAIAMTRIQRSVSVSAEVAAFSPDGSRFAAVVWRGDLDRNVNVYSLLVFEERGAGERDRAPSAVLSLDFEGDPENQMATPISDVTFLGDNRTLLFVGRRRGQPGYLYTLDTASKKLREVPVRTTPVRSYGARPDGTLAVYAAAVREDDQPPAPTGGLFLLDPSIFPERAELTSAGFPFRPADRQMVRQYFLGRGHRLVFDSRQSRPPGGWPAPPGGALVPSATPDREGGLRMTSTLTADPTGRHALLYPYLLAGRTLDPEKYRYYQGKNDFLRRLAAPYAVVDTKTGKLTTLLEAPHPIDRNGGPPVWAPDGRSVIIHSLLPLASPDAAAQPPRWLEVDLASQRFVPLPVPEDWRVRRWDPRSNALLLRKGSAFATLPRTPEGGWGPLQQRGEARGLNPAYEAASNGRIAVGVVEDLGTAPELAAYDLERGSIRVLTDLNPHLRQLRYGPAEEIQWTGKLAGASTGYLVRPPDQRPGVRVPLVLLFDDGVLNRSGRPFVLDGNLHLCGHPIQMLAAEGMAVLYMRQPAGWRPAAETPQESPVIRDQVASAIDHLARLGLVDPERVGLVGWSRAGYWTDQVLIHEPRRVAAALKIDGGSSEYLGRARPYRDDELARIEAPVLVEAHGPSSLILHAPMFDRLKAIAKPVDLVYFPRAPHAVTMPRDRHEALGAVLDWFRYWLLGKEDPDPAKARQYARWRDLRQGRAPARGGQAGVGLSGGAKQSR